LSFQRTIFVTAVPPDTTVETVSYLDSSNEKTNGHETSSVGLRTSELNPIVHENEQ
jgi:hypothetical protein